MNTPANITYSIVKVNVSYGPSPQLYEHCIVLNKIPGSTPRKTQQFLTFKSSQEHQELMQNLVSFFTRVIKHHPSALETMPYAKHIWWRDAYQIFAPIKGTPEEQAVQFLILRDTAVGVRYAATIAKRLVEKYAACSFTNRNDVVLYLNPLRGQWGLEDFKVLKQVESRTILKNCDDPNYREFIRDLSVAVNIICNYSPDSLATNTFSEILGKNGKKFPPASKTPTRSAVTKNFRNYKYLTIDGFRIPFTSEPYREYLKTLSVPDVLSLIGKVPQNTPHEALIPFTENLLSRRNQTVSTSRESILQATSAFTSLINKCDDSVGNRDFWLKLNQQFLKLSNNPTTLSLISNYFTDLSSTELSEKTITEAVGVVFGSNINKWVTRQEHAHLVVKKLLTIKPVNEIIPLLLDVSGDSPLSLDEWRGFLEIHADYVGTPAAWWIPLIRGKKVAKDNADRSASFWN